jgi:hypothetical protein
MSASSEPRGAQKRLADAGVAGSASVSTQRMRVAPVPKQPRREDQHRHHERDAFARRLGNV